MLDQDNPETEGDPFRLNAVTGASAVTLRWQHLDIPMIDAYLLYRCEEASDEYLVIATIESTNNSYVDEDISEGRTYRYKIAAVDNDGIITEISNQVALTIHSLAVFSVNNGETETSSVTVTLNFRASDCDSIWAWNGIPADSISGLWLVKNTPVASFEWELTTGPGLKTVNAFLFYTDGQREYCSDTIDPAEIAPSIVIAGGADSTTTRFVELSLEGTGAYEMMLSNSPDFLDAIWENFSTSISWALSDGGGVKTVYAKLRNDFMIEAESQNSIIPATIAADLLIADGDDSTTTRYVVLTINAIGATEIMLSNSEEYPNAVWQQYSSSIPWSLEMGDGIKTVYARIRNDFSMLEEVTDTIVPTPMHPTLLIADGDDYTPTRTVELSMVAAGATSMMLSNSLDFSGSNWQNYSGITTWQLTTGASIKTVYARYRNDFDIEQATSDSIAPSPIAPSLLINYDADYTSTRSVELSIQAMGGAEILVSNLPDFLDASWQPFTASMPWVLMAGEGQKTVFVRVRNDFLIEADDSDTIILDETEPDVSGATSLPANGASEVPNPVSISWSGMSDSLSGIASYRVLIGTENPPAEILYLGPAESYSVGQLSYDTNYYWQVVAIDAAGNEASGPIWSFRTAHWADWRVPDQVQTIAEAAASADPYDVILVSPGVYYESDIQLPPGVMVVGNASSPESVLIDAGDYGRHFSGSGIEIEGLTLMNGIEHSGSGGSISGSGEIRFCIFEGNRASQNGGAVSGNFRISNSEFRSNHASQNGGAIANGATVTDCYFVSNSSDDYWGSAVYSSTLHSSFFDYHSGNVVYNCAVDGCTFTNINAYWSGIIRTYGLSSTISNCVFYGNSTSGAMIVLVVPVGGTVYSSVENCTFYDEPIGVETSCQQWGTIETSVNNCIFVNVSEPYRTSGGGDVCSIVADCCNIWNGKSTATDNGNFSADPMFCDPQSGNFSIHVNSPCQPENSGGCGLVGALPSGCGGMIPRLR